MDVSRLRWGLGAALALVALLAAASSLQTYLGHKLWLGGLAVIVLAAIDVAGFVSLAQARRRILSQDSPPISAQISRRSKKPSGGR